MIGVGTSIAIRNTNLVVRFDRVVDDSRCPSDAQCISAGDATVRIAVSAGRVPARRYDLHVNGTRDAVSGQYRLTLIELKPVATSARPVRPGAYVLTLRASRL